MRCRHYRSYRGVFVRSGYHERSSLGGGYRDGVNGPGWSHLPATYDVVADEYAARFSDELDAKPFDRELLNELAASIAGTGTACDLGCGPGQIGAYLAASGCDVLGVDVSAGMLREARKRHPDMRFELGDMRALPLADASLVAVVCFYALIHLPRGEVLDALAEIARVLVPGGILVLAVHGGEGELHVDNWFNRSVSVDLSLFGTAELIGLLQKAGFTACEATEREPYPDEHQTPRLYVRANRARTD
jgi:SAM-dependent methyltransferase